MATFPRLLGTLPVTPHGASGLPHCWMSLTEQPNPITDDIDLASEEGMRMQMVKMVGWKC
jgi:hypothetical protein